MHTPVTLPLISQQNIVYSHIGDGLQKAKLSKRAKFPFSSYDHKRPPEYTYDSLRMALTSHAEGGTNGALKHILSELVKQEHGYEESLLPECSRLSAICRMRSRYRPLQRTTSTAEVDDWVSNFRTSVAETLNESEIWISSAPGAGCDRCLMKA